MSRLLSNTSSQESSQDQLIGVISPWLAPLGYQIVYLEVQSHRQKVLRIFIDFLDGQKTIGIEDCVKVTKALDPFLDQNSEINALLPGSYELEVSSPGADRPLRTLNDFQRFQGRQVKVHVYRPMTADELANAPYQERNPKQKNFLGTLTKVEDGKIILSLPTGTSGKKSKTAITNSAEGTQIAIPLPLISKANLEPQFDFEGGHERE